MTLVFVRHGETALNAARVLQPPDTPLNARGLQQAQAVALRLVALRPAGVTSSDLPRAVQTAQAIVQTIAQAAGAVPLRTTPLLQERHFGVLRGQSYDALGFDALNSAEAPEGGESWNTFAARVDAALALLVQQRAALDGPLVVVTHGLVIRALLQRLPLQPGCTVPARLGNTGVTVIDAAAPHTITLANCLLHLDLDGAALEDGSSLSGG